MDTPPGSLPPEEEAFCASWLGRLWPRYRPLFETGAEGRGFEWRAAVFPLWLVFPGLHRHLAALAALVLALTAAVAVLVASAPSPAWILVLSVAQLVSWPAATVGLLLASMTGGTGALAVYPLATLAISIAVGMRAPRWIVAEGRRRWGVHAARAAAGAAPVSPRAVFAPHPLALASAATAAGLVLSFALVGRLPGEKDRHSVEMRQALRHLAEGQDRYFGDSLRYSGTVPAGVTTTAGVTLEIVAASDSGWAAIARHRATSRTCAIFVGRAPAPIPGSYAGEPACTMRGGR